MTYAEYMVSALSWSIIGLTWGWFISTPGVRLVMKKGASFRTLSYNTRKAHRRIH